MKKIQQLLIIILAFALNADAQCPVSISAGGPTTFCKGNFVVLTATNGAGYAWQWKKNNVNISGATSPTYSAYFSGTYTVSVNTSGGCTSVSNSIVVSVTLDNVQITTHN